MRRAEVEAIQDGRARGAAARQDVGARWAPVAGWILLLSTAVLTMAQWELVADSTTGRSNSYRDTALSILLGLCGLRMAVAPGRHTIAAPISALAGAGLVLGGLLAAHDSGGLVVLEVTTGSFAVLCAMAALASPVPDPQDPTTWPDGSPPALTTPRGSDPGAPAADSSPAP